MSKGRIIALILTIATIIVIIAFVDSCHEGNDPPPGGDATEAVRMPEAETSIS